MFTEKCIEYPRKIKNSTGDFDGFVIEQQCPEQLSANCTPIFYAERSSGIFPNITVERKCFGNIMPQLQYAPEGAKCWCGNGFKGNNTPYYIWEPCMANCITCDTTRCIGGSVWNIAPNCCGMPGLNSGSYPYNNCTGCNNEPFIPEPNPNAHKTCCTYICQPIPGTTKVKSEKSYVKKFEVKPHVNFDFEVEDLNINLSCCDRRENVKKEAVISGGALIYFNPPVFGQDLFTSQFEIDEYTSTTSCVKSFGLQDKYSVTLNLGRSEKEDVQDVCYTDCVYKFFENFMKKIPKIGGVSLDLDFNNLKINCNSVGQPSNCNQKFVIKIDKKSSINQEPVYKKINCVSGSFDDGVFGYYYSDQIRDRHYGLDVQCADGGRSVVLLFKPNGGFYYEDKFEEYIIKNQIDFNVNYYFFININTGKIFMQGLVNAQSYTAPTNSFINNFVEPCKSGITGYTNVVEIKSIEDIYSDLIFKDKLNNSARMNLYI
jgi:hypothetical protein